MNITEKLINIFKLFGYELDESELNIDSFDFISIIIEIESEFNIIIPDNFLNMSLLNKKILINVISSLLENN